MRRFFKSLSFRQKQKRLYFLILCLSSPHLSMTWGWDEFGILNSDDIQLAQDHDSPALQSPIGEEPHWESFNEWLCFSSDTVQLGCYDKDSGVKIENTDSDDVNERSFYTTLLVEDRYKLYAFESPGWKNLEGCQSEIAEWRHTLENQEGFCTFAAELPNQTENKEGKVSNWVIYGIKSHTRRILAPIYEEDA